MVATEKCSLFWLKLGQSKVCYEFCVRCIHMGTVVEITQCRWNASLMNFEKTMALFEVSVAACLRFSSVAAQHQIKCEIWDFVELIVLIICYLLCLGFQ